MVKTGCEIKKKKKNDSSGYKDQKTNSNVKITQKSRILLSFSTISVEPIASAVAMDVFVSRVQMSLSLTSR